MTKKEAEKAIAAFRAYAAADNEARRAIYGLRDDISEEAFDEVLTIAEDFSMWSIERSEGDASAARDELEEKLTSPDYAYDPEEGEEEEEED